MGKIKMKNTLAILLVLFCTVTAKAQPFKVVTLDFTDEVGVSFRDKTTQGNNLSSKINSKLFSEKGIYFLQKALLESPEFVLIDRRDFVRQIERLQPRDGSDPTGRFFATKERKTPLKPTFFSAARTLGGDALLRGSLISLSTSKQKINQGGWKTEFVDLKLRVMIQALSTQDGSVLAMEEGKASRKFRQTQSVQTEIGEDDLLQLYEDAVASTIPNLEKALAKHLRSYNSNKYKIWVTTTADPAMIELDGILIGSTPSDGIALSQGDHTLSISKPGFQDITKKIMVRGNLKINVPMISNQLNAQERERAFSNLNLRIIEIR